MKQPGFVYHGVPVTVFIVIDKCGPFWSEVVEKSVEVILQGPTGYLNLSAESDDCREAQVLCSRLKVTKRWKLN